MADDQKLSQACERVARHVKAKEVEAKADMELAVGNSDMQLAQSQLGIIKRMQALHESILALDVPPRQVTRSAAAESPSNKRRRSSSPDLHRQSIGNAIGSIASFPTIVRDSNGTYTEIRCPSCGGNFSSSTNAFFNGVAGLGMHMRRAHAPRYTALRTDEVLLVATHQTLTRAEVDGLLAGDTDVYKVPMIPSKSQSEPVSVPDYANWHIVPVPNCPTVVAAPTGIGHVELACYICNANAHTKDNFFSVPGDILRHIKTAHHIRYDKQTLEQCIYKQLTAAESVQLSNGTYTVKKRLGPGLTKPDTIPDYPKSIDEEHPTILWHVGKKSSAWVEMRCYICGANADSKGRWLASTGDYKGHVATIHGISKKSTPPVLPLIVIRRCIYATLSRDVVDKIKAGTPDAYPVPRIACQMRPGQAPPAVMTSSQQHTPASPDNVSDADSLYTDRPSNT